MTLPGRADLTVDPLGGLHLSPPRAPRDLGARLLRELTVQGGTIRIGGGPPVPFGATGAILRLPDGTQVAVGRTHEGPDAPACRWTVAGPGEHIPTHPPGATALFRIDPCGTIHPAGRC